MNKLIKTIIFSLSLLNPLGAMASNWPQNDAAGGPDPGSRESRAAQELAARRAAEEAARRAAEEAARRAAAEARKAAVLKASRM